MILRCCFLLIAGLFAPSAQAAMTPCVHEGQTYGWWFTTQDGRITTIVLNPVGGAPLVANLVSAGMDDTRWATDDGRVLIVHRLANVFRVSFDGGPQQVYACAPPPE